MNDTTLLASVLMPLTYKLIKVLIIAFSLLPIQMPGHNVGRLNRQATISSFTICIGEENYKMKFIDKY